MIPSETDTIIPILHAVKGVFGTFYIVHFFSSEGCWLQQELQLLTDFWKKEVACPPFSLPAVTSYVKLLQLPILTLKSCLQLLAYHLVGVFVCLSVCLCVCVCVCGVGVIAGLLLVFPPSVPTSQSGVVCDPLYGDTTGGRR